MLEIANCSTGFAGRRVIRDLSLSLPAGELLAVVGPSGCGKSTLLHLAAGIHAPWQGAVHLHGERLEPGDRRIGLVQQHYGLFPWFTVEKNVALGLRFRGFSRQEQRRRVRESLEELGLADTGGRFPGELSGGEQQRVALARTTAYEPELLLLDEPFSALDAFTREELQEALLRLERRHRRASLLVTHSLEEATFLADRIGMMYETPTRLTVVPNPWERPPARRSREDRGGEEFLHAVAELRRIFEDLHHDREA